MRWLCSHHRCVYSKRAASDCGGMLFRCFDCPAAFSDEYLQDGFEPIDTSQVFASLNYAPPTSAEYIRCAKCVSALPNVSLVPRPEEPAEEQEEEEEVVAVEEKKAQPPDNDVVRERGGKGKGTSNGDEEEKTGNERRGSGRAGRGVGHRRGRNLYEDSSEGAGGSGSAEWVGEEGEPDEENEEVEEAVSDGSRASPRRRAAASSRIVKVLHKRGSRLDSEEGSRDRSTKRLKAGHGLSPETRASETGGRKSPTKTSASSPGSRKQKDVVPGGDEGGEGGGGSGGRGLQGGEQSKKKTKKQLHAEKVSSKLPRAKTVTDPARKRKREQQS